MLLIVATRFKSMKDCSP